MWDDSQGPDVPLLPPDCSITSPERQERTTSKGYERLLSVLNKGAAPNLNTTVHPVEFFFYMETGICRVFNCVNLYYYYYNLDLMKTKNSDSRGLVDTFYFGL